MLNGKKIASLEQRLAAVEALLLAGGGELGLLVIERGRAVPHLMKYRELAGRLGPEKLRELVDEIKATANVPKGPADDIARYEGVGLASCAIVRCARWTAADDSGLAWWIARLEELMRDD